MPGPRGWDKADSGGLKAGVLDMWAYHDSRDALYRNPFGAAPVGGTVVLRLDVGGVSDATVTLRTWIDGEGEGFVPMTAERLSDRVRYTCEYECGQAALVWYTFVIERADGKVVRYGAKEGHTGGEGALCDWQPPSFQLTVYKPREVKPDWFTHGIVYQIFPDRYRRGPGWHELARNAMDYHTGDSDDGIPGPMRHVVHRWDVEPHYERTKDGRIASWDFYGGTLSGIREKLPHLADMGVTVLYLNPIFEARSNHRYDTADFLVVDHMLGDNEEFKHLCERAAEYGISVVLDGVFNHVGSDSRAFNRYNTYDEPGAWQAHKVGVKAAEEAGSEDPMADAAAGATGPAADAAHAAELACSPHASWFNFKPDGTYDCWWGVDDLPAVNETDPTYQDFIAGRDGVVRHWLRLGARGWRLDVADELPDEFIKDIKSAALAERDDALVLGEVWEDASNKVSYGKLRTYLLGDELDSAMNYPFRTAVLDFLLGKITSADAAERLMSIAENYPPEAMHAALNLLSSHDRPRMLSVLGGALERPEGQPWPDDFPGRLNDGERMMAKARFWLATLMQMTFEGVPSIYYGDEVGMEGLSDPYNRGPFPWGSGDADCRTMYRNVIQLRQALPVLTEGIVRPVSCGDDVLGWWRLPAGAELADGAVGAETPGASGKFAVPGPSVCVLVNRNLRESRNVTISNRGAQASEVIGDQPLRRDGDSVSLTLGPCGSAVVLFDEAQRLSKPMEPGAGIVCHITSVPNLGRPGTLGKPCRDFVDYLARTGQRYWQILPVNPTDSFGSPYAGSSVFAGNERLLEYSREELLEKFRHFKPTAAYRAFCEKNADWLDPYAAYVTICEDRPQESWQEWPPDIHHYDVSLLGDPHYSMGIAFHKFCQWEFQCEWDELHAYANKNGVKIIGDIPMYPACASADVWANPGQFSVDRYGRVEMQAGTPPDSFAADGQLWGNPTYRWDRMKEDGYAWWLRRMERTFELYDVVRLDHFLGFQNYYSVPRGGVAADGSWHIGPGIDLFRAAYKKFGPLPLLAEDLGSITPATRALLAQVGCPGMDVLLFADGDVRNGWVPKPGRVAYTSTHDTSTLVGWCATRYGFARDDAQDLARKLMEQAYDSDAGVVMCTLQDAMLLGDEARMNVPGVAGGNWRWHADGDELAASEACLLGLTEQSGRMAK